ncbi:hypothetical protein [Arachidicoccus terrestris]|uniref:hypothetical protein n=1 Tax=Arachidicoccus terrestris TaxID=2875539 RepID=UPI001CC3741E|nr:hypothetical protein [Arachidicoccus terrestris]UAY56806.1 hypothetical protein K9M52_07395 [Arachidicoccus terrestris]
MDQIYAQSNNFPENSIKFLKGSQALAAVRKPEASPLSDKKQYQKSALVLKKKVATPKRTYPPTDE